MKDDPEQSGGAMVPSASRGLTRGSTGLVRRGLDDLLNGQPPITSSDNSSSVASRPPGAEGLTRLDKVPRLKVGQWAYAPAKGIAARVKTADSSDRGPVYTLSGGPADKQWLQDDLTKYDEERYAKAKAILLQGMTSFDSEGMTRVQQMQALVGAMRKEAVFTDEVLKAMKPDVMRFMQELEAGKIDLSEEQGENP